jgi:invasion protein IalB
MEKGPRKTVLVAAAGLLVAATLAAQGAGAAGRPKPEYNPNQIICESRNEIGSRLKRIRVCHTAQEWEEVRTQEKVGLMRKQYNGSPGAGATNLNDAPN